MWISPAYSDEYRNWISRGIFEEIYNREADCFADVLAGEQPALVASSLSSHATCYYRRGIVALMAAEQNGWADIQCGYWAALYALLFELKAVTLMGWGSGKLSGKNLNEMVMLLGLARVFRQEGDELRLSEMIATHFSWGEAIGERIQSGRKMLQSILEPATPFTLAELLKDRKECCQKRDTWPERPTAIDPFGVLDVEIMLRHPVDAAFRFAGEFQPTDDECVAQAIVAFHTWYK